MRILLVEDEKNLAEPLAEILRASGIQCDIADNGEDGILYATSGIYDVILLDIMLPKKDGYQVLSAIRTADIHTPVLMLTALGETAHTVKGLDAGADDYLTKPFSTQELLARIRALGRRKETVILSETVADSNTTFLPSQSKLSTEKKSTDLSLKEVSVFQVLADNYPQIVPKSLILDKVWGFDDSADPNHVEVYISFLRKKLEYLQSNLVITTVRGLGYRLEVEKVGEVKKVKNV